MRQSEAGFEILLRLSRRAKLTAMAVATLLFGSTLAIIPFGSRPGPIIASVVLISAVAISLLDFLTAYFLAIRFRSSRQPFLGALAGAFGFVAVLVFSQMLVFPNVLSAQGLFDGGPQSSIWMWALWHAGFPILVIIALLLRTDRLFHAEATRLRIGTIMIFAAPALALALTYLCISRGHELPIMILGNNYTGLRHSPIMALFIGATIAALLTCVWITRLKDLLSLWLAIALLAGLCEGILTLSGASRYDCGWYAGRVQGMISASTVFCALIFELSQLYSQLVRATAILQQRAVRDGLTGAFNRGYFTEIFPREMRRAIRAGSTLSLIMVDVDHFKAYNDLNGHQSGDECLIAIVNAVQPLMRRAGDVLARYGGEEFVVLLPQTDANGALRMAHEIRAAVVGLARPHSNTAAGIVTISLGVTSIAAPGQGQKPEALLRHADQALYQAKREGRDTIRVVQEADPTEVSPGSRCVVVKASAA